jgi:glycosyltransferase involved in cell wall biosynthesis
MKILYIGVHTNEIWRSEFWISKAFKDLGHEIIEYDYKSNRKKFKPWRQIGKELSYLEKNTKPDIIFLQRGKKMSPIAFNLLESPIIYWSTEPIKLKKDADKLLYSNKFEWVFVHSYSCLDRIKSEFPHLIEKCSVMHNACPKDIINSHTVKSLFAIFNRNLSNRRKKWLQPSEKQINIIQGKFGNDYFHDLRKAKISVNIHYSDKNLDDFETGIFEAMASGCAIISESLNHQTLVDLGMEDAILQVNSPFELKEKIQLLYRDERLLRSFQQKSQQAIQHNTWHDRAQIMNQKFQEVCN